MAGRKRKEGAEIIEAPQETGTIEIPNKITLEAIKEVQEPEIKTVIGSNKAEALQKEGGWVLISAVKIGVDDGGLTVKEWKFRKE